MMTTSDSRRRGTWPSIEVTTSASGLRSCSMSRNFLQCSVSVPRIKIVWAMRDLTIAKLVFDPKKIHILFPILRLQNHPTPGIRQRLEFQCPIEQIRWEIVTVVQAHGIQDRKGFFHSVFPDDGVATLKLPFLNDSEIDSAALRARKR